MSRSPHQVQKNLLTVQKPCMLISIREVKDITHTPTHNQSDIQQAHSQNQAKWRQS